MNIVKLQYLVHIQQRIGTADELGQPTESWENVASVYADFRHLKGLETLRAGAPTSVVRASARIRYRPGLTAGMRLVWKNFVYNITTVLPQGERNQFLDLTCERVSEIPLGD